MRTFNVIIHNFNTGKFEKYDILAYLSAAWDQCAQKHSWVYSVDYDIQVAEKPEDVDIAHWVDSELRHQFWSRCQYEMVLSGWPDTNKTAKVDIYWQCEMNMDLIVELFKENLKG